VRAAAMAAASGGDGRVHGCARAGEGAVAACVRQRHVQEALGMLRGRSGAELAAEQSRDGTSALMAVCRYGGQREMEAVLEHAQQQPGLLDTQDRDGWSALMYACAERHERAALTLIEAGANCDLTTSDGWTALLFACRYGLQEVARQLIVKRSAKVNASQSYGYTPLLLACKYRMPQIARLLVEAGADVNAKNRNSTTPVMLAARHNQPQLLKCLLDAGADVNAVSRDGWNALMLACQQPATEGEDEETLLDCVKICYVAGSFLDQVLTQDDRNSKSGFSTRGSDAREVAVRSGRSDAVAFLDFCRNNELANLLASAGETRATVVSLFDHGCRTLEACTKLSVDDLLRVEINGDPETLHAALQQATKRSSRRMSGAALLKKVERRASVTSTRISTKIKGIFSTPGEDC